MLACAGAKGLLAGRRTRWTVGAKGSPSYSSVSRNDWNDKAYTTLTKKNTSEIVLQMNTTLASGDRRRAGYEAHRLASLARTR